VPNEEQTSLWDGPRGAHWAAEHEHYRRMLVGFGDRLIAAVDARPGERWLDVGCGNGELALRLGSTVGPGGAIAGVDLSEAMLDVGRQAAASAGLAQVSFIRADAQVHAFEPASFDGLLSRFGIMFFDDPPLAIANLVAALRPGGRVVLLIWRELAANEWLMVPVGAALEHVPMADLDDPSVPGPFSLSDPDRVRALLAGGGLDRIELDAVDEPIWLGTGSGDALGFLQRSEMARRLVGGVDEALAAEVWASVARALEQRTGPDGVVLDGSAWLVTARKPA
jgi:SAM-dependent methyltransferase